MANRMRYEWRLVALDPKQIEFWDAFGWEAFAPRGDQVLMRRRATPCEQESAPLTIMDPGTPNAQPADPNALVGGQEYELLPPGLVVCIRGELYDRETMKSFPFPCPKCTSPAEPEDAE